MLGLRFPCMVIVSLPFGTYEMKLNEFVLFVLLILFNYLFEPFFVESFIGVSKSYS